MSLGTRIQHAWNAFMNRDPTKNEISYVDGTYKNYIGSGYSHRPDRVIFTRGNERTIISSIINRIALDVSGMTIQHCILDKDGRFLDVVDSKLNNCLTLEANVDQTGRVFMQDVVMSMLDEGCVAIVPVDTTLDPLDTDSYDISSMRTGQILEWFPRHVRVRVYNDKTGMKQDVIMPKKMVAIIENPFYSIMNEPNSTLQRLRRKLGLLDVTDENTASGKLDLIIGLPYVIKTDARREQANKRMESIEQQLAKSKYGIAYTDGTEKITQLNRPVENNLMNQVEYFTNMLFSQMGITQSILDGTADEQVMLNYTHRTIEPIISLIADEMSRKFITKTSRTQGKTILYFIDPFRLVPVNNIAEIADKFTRNEIMSSNEVRQIIGMKPSKDPKADRLENSNINHPEEPFKENNNDYAEEKQYEKEE